MASTMAATLPFRRIVGPRVIATAAPVACNETAQGRSPNRRVEVKVLVNRAWPAECDAIGGEVPVVLCSVNVETNDYHAV